MPARSSRKREPEYAGDADRPLGALILAEPLYSGSERARDATEG
ncbi:hypothetical protein ABZ461_35025 [Actinacidiphila glaucinigra]